MDKKTQKRLEKLGWSLLVVGGILVVFAATVMAFDIVLYRLRD